MRILKFHVKGQNLVKDQQCDFSGIVAETEDISMRNFFVVMNGRDAKK